MSAVSAHLPRRDVTLRMNDIEAHDVHCALAITVQLLQQIGAQPGGDLTPESEDREIVAEQMRPGTLRYRPASHAHRTRTPTGAWTLVLMGRKRQPWGFWSRGRFGWPWADHEKAFGFGMRCPTDGERPITGVTEQ